MIHLFDVNYHELDFLFIFFMKILWLSAEERLLFFVRLLNMNIIQIIYKQHAIYVRLLVCYIEFSMHMDKIILSSFV